MTLLEPAFIDKMIDMVDGDHGVNLRRIVVNRLAFPDEKLLERFLFNLVRDGDTSHAEENG